MMDIAGLLAALTLEEKISLLAGRDLWHTHPVPRLGIPSVKMTDGPNGARGAWRDMGPPSACLPVGVALGATWNVALLEQLGAFLAEEVRLKGAHLLLAPTVNIHRTPLAGRNFECYAEDPFLSGTLAAALIRGLQANGVGACIKHFVCNDQEFERTSISAEVGPRPLREIYLEPFRLALTGAGPWAVMSAYNRINGVHASENETLLQQLLKEEWGFDGLVLSDWFGTYSSVVVGRGLDLEMPGPARWMDAAAVRRALDDGRLTPAALDDSVRRLLRLAERTGAFDRPAATPEQGADTPAGRALLRRAAWESIVLLRNSGLLPLAPDRAPTIAVIGELARWPRIMGGGSSQVRPHPVVSPLDGIRARAGETVTVTYAPGCWIHRRLPPPNADRLTRPDGGPGLDLAIYDNLDCQGEPAFTDVTDRVQFGWFDHSVPGVDQTRFSVRLTGFFTPAESGEHTFGLSGIGRCRLRLDGREVLTHEGGPGDYAEPRLQLSLTAGQPVRLTLAFRWQGDPRFRSLRLGHLPPQAEDLMAEAVDLARKADVVILLAGLTDEWESEGFDRPDMTLPGEQDALIARVAAANPQTIVVLNAGSAVAMPWVDQAAAVLTQWYNGQEGGHALADVLFGDANPSGKLPTTFPRQLQDNPAYLNYPGENGQVLYGEGLFVGYRYYDRKGIEPLFPFGHGLSYTRFDYRALALEADQFTAEDGLTLQFELGNAGPRAGQEIVQLYVRELAPRLARPDQELKAFAKVALAPGQRQTVRFHLGREAFWHYDPARGGWRADPGEYDIRIGASSRDIRLRRRVRLVE